jgi:hypothetical protein
MSDIAIWDEALSAEQIEALAAGGAVIPESKFAITEFTHSVMDNTITLTWDSREGEKYAVKYSQDMTNWDGDLDDGVDADAGESTTLTFDLALIDLTTPDRVFFRVERQ